MQLHSSQNCPFAKHSQYLKTEKNTIKHYIVISIEMMARLVVLTANPGRPGSNPDRVTSYQSCLNWYSQLGHQAPAASTVGRVPDVDSLPGPSLEYFKIRAKKFYCQCRWEKTQFLTNFIYRRNNKWRGFREDRNRTSVGNNNLPQTIQIFGSYQKYG